MSNKEYCSSEYLSQEFVKFLNSYLPREYGGKWPVKMENNHFVVINLSGNTCRLEFLVEGENVFTRLEINNENLGQRKTKIIRSNSGRISPTTFNNLDENYKGLFKDYILPELRKTLSNSK